MKDELKREYLERLKNDLSEKDYYLYLSSFDNEETHGMTINFIKLNQSSIDIKFLIDKFSLKEVFKTDRYGYYIYDKNELASRAIFPGKDPLYHVGLYYIQEPSAASVLFNVPIKTSDIVLDLCASPGGKSAQILYSLKKEDGGFLVSNEIDYSRVKALNSNIERLGFDNVAITSDNSKKLSNTFNEFFDKILVDAPCSGEGMMRKSEEARKQWSESLVKSCAMIQKNLVEDAYHMLKPGGIFVYSTCTFSKEEDEELIDNLLKNHSDLSIIKSEKCYPFNSLGEGQFYAIISKAGENNIKSIISSKKSFDGIRLIRYGVSEYDIDKGIKKPTHESTHCDSIIFENVVELDDAEVVKYLRGEVIKKELSFSGYCKVTYKNLGLGLAKYVNGVLKNHYPKGLRLY